MMFATQMVSADNADDDIMRAANRPLKSSILMNSGKNSDAELNRKQTERKPK